MSKEEIYLNFERLLEEYADMIMLSDREKAADIKDQLQNLLLEAMKI